MLGREEEVELIQGGFHLSATVEATHRVPLGSPLRSCTLLTSWTG